MKDKSLRYQSSSDLQKDLTRFLNKEYPDFTPSDFSTFMKFLFENEYLLAQERMVNYARLDFGSLNELSESTQFNRAITPSSLPPLVQPPDAPEHLNLNPSPQLRPIVIGNVPPPDMPAFPKVDTGINILQNAQTQIGPLPRTRQITLTGLSQNTGLRKPIPPALAPRRPAASSTSQLATRSGVTSTGIRYRAPAKPPSSELAKALFSFIIMGLMLGGIYFVAPKKMKLKFTEKGLAVVDQVLAVVLPAHQTSGSHQALADAAPSNDDKKDYSSTAATVKILVKSNPGRARIYLNSEDKGVTTPAAIEVEANKPFTLTLLADGYLQYTTRMTAFKDGQEVSADLTQVKFGYININVINAGIDTIVYIDNLELKDRPPITRYPVQSGKPIMIKAVHPFSGTSAETTVTVGVDEKKTIDLILTNPARDKAENKK